MSVVNSMIRIRMYRAGTSAFMLGATLVIGLFVVPSTVHATDWAAQNRFTSLSTVILQQDYREADTQGLTADGTLDTERGTAPGYSLQVRWQGNLRSLPLWAQAGALWAQGQTSYDGYLQNGNILTPYRANTGNTWRSQSVALGLPITLSEGGAWQATPHLQWTNRHWQRNLVQYSETYRHSSFGPGLLLQWAPSPRWQLEASAAWRKQSPVKVSVPTLGFAAQQSGSTETSVHLAATWQPPEHWLGGGWQLHTQVEHSRWENGQSPVVNGLQAPPNQNRQTSLGLALGWRY